MIYSVYIDLSQITGLLAKIKGIRKMKIIITENEVNLEPGVYSIEQIAEIMQVLVDAIKNGERVTKETV